MWDGATYFLDMGTKLKIIQTTLYYATALVLLTRILSLTLILINNVVRLTVIFFYIDITTQQQRLDKSLEI